jgi:rod shape-determining protein MreD
MSSSRWTQVEGLARRLTPGVLTLLLLILGSVPLQIPYLAPIGPSFLLISAYYWAVHRPELLPAPAVFGFGVVSDLLGGAPLGSGTLVLLLAYAAARAYRRPLLGASFPIVWLGFAVIAAGANLALWIVATVLAGAVPDPRPALFAGLLEIALYPVIAALFMQAERLVEEDDE